MHIWHLRIRASSLQFRASKINVALARMDKLVKKLMSNPDIYSKIIKYITEKYPIFQEIKKNIGKNKTKNRKNISSTVKYKKKQLFKNKYIIIITIQKFHRFVFQYDLTMFSLVS
jgi:hypothetical protein